MRNSYTLDKDQLKGEYKDAFEQIDMYCLSLNINDDAKEERMSELLDIFLNAQEEEKPVEKITGSNIESFCKRYFSGLNWKNQLLELADTLKTLAWFLLVIEVIFLVSFVFDEKPIDNILHSGEAKSDIGSLIFIFIATYAL